jgi:hypothetical protein
MAGYGGTTKDEHQSKMMNDEEGQNSDKKSREGSE